MIPTPYKIVAVFVLASVIAGFSYMRGLQSGRIDQLKDTVDAYETRKGIDNGVSSVDRYRVCVDLGGLPDQCQQLRGLDEAAEGK